VFSALFVTRTRLQVINHVGKKVALEWHYTSEAAGSGLLCTRIMVFANQYALIYDLSCRRVVHWFVTHK